jgi:hypothetical protein
MSNPREPEKFVSGLRSMARPAAAMLAMAVQSCARTWPRALPVQRLPHAIGERGQQRSCLCRNHGSQRRRWRHVRRTANRIEIPPPMPSALSQS